MTAVLLQSNKIGSTGWISLRRGNYLRVQGMERGDWLNAFFLPQGESLSIVEDGLFLLPSGAEHVRVEHSELSLRGNGGGVNVDLTRVKG